MKKVIPKELLEPYEYECPGCPTRYLATPGTEGTCPSCNLTVGQVPARGPEHRVRTLPGNRALIHEYHGTGAN